MPAILADMRAPPARQKSIAFVEVHEYDFALDREQAVYACRLEDWGLIEESKKEARCLDQTTAISWAEFVKDYGDLRHSRRVSPRNPRGMGRLKSKKADEWIHLLTVWRDSFKDCASCPDDRFQCASASTQTEAS